jgi:hypothetical protein
MRVTSKLLALALTAALQPAFADTVSLSFEDLKANPLDLVHLLDRYKDSGIQFGGDADAWGVVSNRCDGFAGFKSYDGGCGAVWLIGDPRDAVTDASASFTINFAAGFTSGIDSYFYYSALDTVTIEVFDGLNGTGNGTTQTVKVSDACGITNTRFCDWSKLTLDFSGTAYSIVISGADESFMLDGLSLARASSTTPTPLPEPGSIALAMGALGALGWTRKRVAR